MNDEQALIVESVVNSDAIALLTEDHRKAKRLFDEYDRMNDSSPEEKFEIAKEVCGDILIHMAIEEAIFYPVVRQHIDDDNLMDEAQDEHEGAKELIRELGDIKPEDPVFDAKMTRLAEEIEHHVHEEESQMFPKILLSALDLDALGKKLLTAKKEMRTNLGLPAEAE